MDRVLLGKPLSKVHDLEINWDFTPFPDIDIIELPDDIVKNLSTDQKNCYLLLSAMKPGTEAVYPKNWLTSNVDPLINHGG